MAVLSLGWLGLAAIGKLEQGDQVVSLWEGFRDPLAWLVLLWPAVGQYSTGEAAQVAGQARYAQLLCTSCGMSCAKVTSMLNSTSCRCILQCLMHLVSACIA